MYEITRPYSTDEIIRHLEYLAITLQKPSRGWYPQKFYYWYEARLLSATALGNLCVFWNWSDAPQVKDALTYLERSALGNSVDATILADIMKYRKGIRNGRTVRFTVVEEGESVHQGQPYISDGNKHAVAYHANLIEDGVDVINLEFVLAAERSKNPEDTSYYLPLEHFLRG